MEKRTQIWLLVCLLLAISVLLTLQARSRNPTGDRQDFTRYFPLNAIRKTSTLDVKFNSYYFAGATPSTVYLGNITAPSHLLVVNTSVSDTFHIHLKIPRNEYRKFSPYLRVLVDSPNFYLSDGSLPGLFKGTLDVLAAKRFMHDGLYFVEAIPITPRSFAFRGIGSHPKENVIGKKTEFFPYKTVNYTILEKQLDGLFCTDGTLHYNKALNILLYVYTYRNQYITMDTSLNLMFKGNTIDSFSRAFITPAEITSKKQRTLASPPAVINKKSLSSGRYLFIHSTLLAKNESQEIFDNSSVIDVYDLITSQYKLSFHLENHNDFEMRHFLVVGNKLFALYDHFLMSYDLDEKHFKVVDSLEETNFLKIKIIASKYLLANKF